MPTKHEQVRNVGRVPRHVLHQLDALPRVNVRPARDVYVISPATARAEMVRSPGGDTSTVRSLSRLYTCHNIKHKRGTANQSLETKHKHGATRMSEYSKNYLKGTADRDSQKKSLPQFVDHHWNSRGNVSDASVGLKQRGRCHRLLDWSQRN